MQALETLVRMVRAGHYKGPLNLTWIGIGGGFDGPNPFNFFNFVHRAPDGCTLTAESLLKNDQHLPHGPRQPLLPGLRQDTAGNRALGADERSRTRASAGGGAGPPRAACRYGRSVMSQPASLFIQVGFDLVCPWCMIGKRHLETALAQLAPTTARCSGHGRMAQLSPVSDAAAGRHPPIASSDWRGLAAPKPWRCGRRRYAPRRERPASRWNPTASRCCRTPCLRIA